LGDAETRGSEGARMKKDAEPNAKKGRRKAAVTFRKDWIEKRAEVPPPGRPHRWYADADLPGLYLVVFATGAKVFYVRYRIGNRRRVTTIGPYGVETIESARSKARRILSAANLGSDVAEERKRRREMPTFGAWVDTYLSRVRLENKDPRSYEKFLGTESPKGKALRARWGGRPLDSITPEDVLAFRDSLRREKRKKRNDAGKEGAALAPKGPPPTTANRWTGAVRACFSAAIRAGHITTNPARGHSPLLEAPPRARVLSADEMERFLRALDAEPDVHVKAAFRLLVETGARLSEVLRARWDDLDFDAGLWRIPSPKSGHPQIVPLGLRTAAMLKKLPRKGPYVVAGRKAEDPRADLKKPWERLREVAKLGDVRIHDIRRSFGLEVAKTAGLHVASKLLRHSSIKVTEAAYAPLGLDELREAVEKRADVLHFPDQKKSAG